MGADRAQNARTEVYGQSAGARVPRGIQRDMPPASLGLHPMHAADLERFGLVES